VIYRSDEVDPHRGNGIFLRGRGCISGAFVQFFDLLVQSTITTYGTKYNKSCTHIRTRARTYTRIRTRAYVHAHKRLISYCKKYNKYLVIV
jgi:hypothetical protein